MYVPPFLLLLHSVLPTLASVALKLTSPDKTAFFTCQTKVKSKIKVPDRSMKDSVHMTISIFIECPSEGQMNTCSYWKEVSRLEKYSMSIKIYIVVLLFRRVTAKVRVRDSLAVVMSSCALKQALEWGGEWGGVGGGDPATFPLLFQENPVSRFFFIAFPNPFFYFFLNKRLKRQINSRIPCPNICESRFPCCSQIPLHEFPLKYFSFSLIPHRILVKSTIPIITFQIL